MILRALTIFFFFTVNVAHASFSFVAEPVAGSDEEDFIWHLVDNGKKKILSVEGSLGGPQLIQVKKQELNKKERLWFVEYSSGLAGTSILSQLDYLILLKEEIAKPGSFVTVFNEPLRLTRWQGTRVVYQKTRPLKVQADVKKVKLGQLDEFSAKTIEIP